MSNFSLGDLEEIIARRAEESTDASYTARLSQKGIKKAAEKLGEEAVETIIAACCEGSKELTAEAADLLYHLLVVLRLGNVDLDDVMDELQRRTAQSGLEEKASR
jgi:phosphoribosyl-ATP pyrophosphohydrolase